MRLSPILLLLTACGGPMARDASHDLWQYRADRGTTVRSDEIRGEEFLNGYDHALPYAGEGDVEIAVLRSGASVLAGVRARPRPRQALLHVALILDVSGSMQDRDKLEYLREGVRVFLTVLSPADRVTIVTFGSDVRTRLRGGDPGQALGIIRTLGAGGRTALHGGLMAGLQALDGWEWDEPGERLAILVTDGLANVGVTDRDRIVADSRPYFERGVQMVCVGVGMEFDDALLSAIARESRGGYHFLDNPSEIREVFADRAEELLGRPATNVRLRLEPADEVDRVFGYRYETVAGGVEIDLGTVGSGGDAVALIRTRGGPLTCRVRWDGGEVECRVDPGGDDPEVERALAIARMAWVLQNLERWDRDVAAAEMDESIERLRRLGLDREDELAEDYARLVRYRDHLPRLRAAPAPVDPWP